MRNITVPAADTGLPSAARPSRKHFACRYRHRCGTRGVSPELSRLIEAHRAAYAAVQDAESRRGEAERVYLEMKPDAPSLYDLYDEGPREEKRLQMSLGLDECKQRVRDNLAFKLRLARGFEDYASPRRLKQLKAAHRAIQRDTLAAVEMFFVKDEAARQSSGLAAAELDCERCDAAEGEALLALCSYRPVSLAETRLRGGYLSSEHLGVDAFDVKQLEALLNSSCVDA